MRIVRSLTVSCSIGGGGLANPSWMQIPLWMQTPLDADPPDADLSLDADPPGCRPHPGCTGCRPPGYRPPWEANPLPPGTE